jgi:hypothetical protein
MEARVRDTTKPQGCTVFQGFEADAHLGVVAPGVVEMASRGFIFGGPCNCLGVGGRRDLTGFRLGPQSAMATDADNLVTERLTPPTTGWSLAILRSVGRGGGKPVDTSLLEGSGAVEGSPSWS